MKLFQLFTLLLAATTILASCDNSDNGIDTGRVELRVSTGISPQTRAAFDTADTQIASGENISVYVDDAGSVSQLYGNNILTADGNGTFSGGTAMYFPQTRNAVDIYAFHTGVSLSEDFPTSEIALAVATDQTTRAGYIASDFLYAAEKNVARTKEVIPLTFYHLLSKLQVAVKAGNGLIEADIVNVEISGTKTNAKLLPNKSIDADMQVITADGNAIDIQTATELTSDFASPQYNNAIVVPQAIAAGATLFKISLADGKILNYNLPAATTFESGKRYIYHITANLTGLAVTSSISDWTSAGNAVYGDAKIATYKYDPTTKTLTLYSAFVLSNDLSGLTGGLLDVPLTEVENLVITGQLNSTQLPLLKKLNTTLTALKSIELTNQTGQIPADFFKDGNVSNTWLTSFSAPAVTTIGKNAFDNCSELVNFSAPAATIINDFAFNKCVALQSISLPNAISINVSTFAYCSALQSILLPKAEKIGANSFRNCTALTSIELPKATSIYKGAFRYCANLEKVTFGSKITMWEAEIFNNVPTTNIDLTLHPDQTGVTGNTWKGYTWKSITQN